MSSTLSTPRWAGLPHSFGGVQRDVHKLFEDFFGPANGNAPASRWLAPAAMWEEEGKFHVELELPGVKSDDVDITFEDQALRIKAARRPAPSNTDPNHPDKVQRKYWHNERAYGETTRVVHLPDTVDPDSIEAELTDGILHLTISKRPETQPKKINVKTG